MTPACLRAAQALLAAVITSAAATALAQSSAPAEIGFPDPAPRQPAADNLLQYFSVPTTRNRYLLDLASLAAGEGESESIRFSTVVESESGVRNVRHEAFHCTRSERKLLAIGRADGSWSVLANSAWQPIRVGTNTNLGHPELFRALCFGGVHADPKDVRKRITADLKQGSNF